MDGRVPVVSLLLHADASATLRDIYGSSALHYATEKGFQEIVTMVMDAPGVDVSVINKDGWTALHLAASCGEVGVARELLKHHAGQWFICNTNVIILLCNPLVADHYLHTSDTVN